jgi:putative oxidoreductase
MTDTIQLFARILISTVFIVFGFLQFTNIAGYTVNPSVVKFSGMIGGVLAPVVIAYLVAAIDFFGGLCLLVGYKVRWAAVVLFVFVILTLFIAHNFWVMEGAPRTANQVNFYKNLAIMGGLLLLFAHGPGRYSLDGRLARS